MNLDELKSVWNTESSDDVHVPANVQQLKKTQHPLDKLKRNMKNEWFMQLLAIIVLAFIPVLQHIPKGLYPVYYTSYAFLVAVSIYYLNCFRNFYNHIVHYSGDTRDSLTEIYREFKLNIRRYHTFGILLLPFALIWMGVYVQTDLLKKGQHLMQLPDQTKMVLAAVAVMTVLILILAVFGWTKYYYGRYLKQLKAILDELESN